MTANEAGQTVRGLAKNTHDKIWFALVVGDILRNLAQIALSSWGWGWGVFIVGLVVYPTILYWTTKPIVLGAGTTAVAAAGVADTKKTIFEYMSIIFGWYGRAVASWVAWVIVTTVAYSIADLSFKAGCIMFMALMGIFFLTFSFGSGRIKKILLVALWMLVLVIIIPALKKGVDETEQYRSLGEILSAAGGVVAGWLKDDDEPPPAPAPGTIAGGPAMVIPVKEGGVLNFQSGLIYDVEPGVKMCVTFDDGEVLQCQKKEDLIRGIKKDRRGEISSITFPDGATVAHACFEPLVAHGPVCRSP